MAAVLMASIVPSAQGVAQVLRSLRDEFALAGCDTPADIQRTLIAGGA